MTTTVSHVALTDLTTAVVSGTGVFDVLMRAAKSHLEEEFKVGRIKGTEYATVYLGSMQAVLQAAVQFTLQRNEQNQNALLKDQQIANAVLEGNVLVAQECKLRAEYDNLQASTLRVASETALLNQKKVTEVAQTNGNGVTADSVLGKQMALYGAQTSGYSRAAEQKAADIMIKSWNVRRTTDETGTPANTDNMLNDAAVGRAVAKLLSGVSA